jgi:hypothetical protein
MAPRTFTRRVTNPQELIPGRKYVVESRRFNLDVLPQPPPNLRFTRGPRKIRDLRFLGIQRIGDLVPHLSGFPILRFVQEGTNRIFAFYLRWPRELLRGWLLWIHHLNAPVEAVHLPLRITGTFTVPEPLRNRGRSL